MANRQLVSRRAQRVLRERRRRRLRVAGGAALVTAAVAVVGALTFIVANDGADDGAVTIDVSMVEFGFDGDLSAPAGPVRLSAVNDGQLAHNIGVRGIRISNETGPGGRIDLDLGDVAPGTYEIYCDISGHTAAGMVATLVIAGPDT